MALTTRVSATALAALAAASIAGPLAATANAAPVSHAAHVHAITYGAKQDTFSRRSGRRHMATLTEPVPSPGNYTLTITLSAHSKHHRTVRLLVGPTWHKVHLGPNHPTRVVKLAVDVAGKTLTVRARARVIKPRLSLQLTPVTVTSTPAAQAAAPAAAPTPVPAPTPAVATPAPSTAPLTIMLPAGFQPVTDYTNLVKDYEFNGNSLPADWAAGTSNYGYQATQYQPSQVTVSGGAANLVAQPDAANQGKQYASGWISTAGSYTLNHGLIDYRAKMPQGQGLWDGLWLTQALGSNPLGEIDVQEMLLANTHTVYGSLHDWTSSASPIWGETQSYNMTADASQAFHDYQVIWQPGEITWAVDGVAYAQYTAAEAAAKGQAWPFDSISDYLICNLAVGAASEWGGAPNTSTTFPATMQIQSVKVWQ
jgi:beta-glucanase (GH16 family)